MRNELDKQMARADESDRRWLYVCEDQLSDEIGPLCRETPESLGIVLIESHWKARLRPYHRQRMAFVWANQRHFAIEQSARGVAVRYLVADRPFRDVLAEAAEDLGTLRMQRPAERELRADLQPLVDAGSIELLEHEGWLTTAEDFRLGAGDEPPWRMDRFYRSVRQRTGMLMDGAKPVGGKYSFDAANRRSWKGEPPAPVPPRFDTADPIKREVARMIDEHFVDHPGRVELADLPATRAEAEQAWAWAKSEALPDFGPYEDAMSRDESTLFHTRISALVNVHRLLPSRVVEEAAAMELPLASQEGFVRQVLGWREFVHHVHDHTDGFRSLGAEIGTPGDGGWSTWSGRNWSLPETAGVDVGAAMPNALDAHQPLPPAFWGVRSGLDCLDGVVQDVWREAWSHHITRLMVLSNVASLLDVSPRELSDWFWVAYVDAWDWVVEPNVLGMGTFAAGEVMTTKPYVSGTPYLHRMGDYCASCAFDPKKDCPISPMYWAYLERHRDALDGNRRMFMPLRNVDRRDEGRKLLDAAIFTQVRDRLSRGQTVTPEDVRNVMESEGV